MFQRTSNIDKEPEPEKHCPQCTINYGFLSDNIKNLRDEQVANNVNVTMIDETVNSLLTCRQKEKCGVSGQYL